MMKLLSFVLAFSWCSTLQAKQDPLEVVKYVDLDRYVGVWYEAARFDQRFQRNCTASQATYTKKENGDIEVLNECRLYTPNGELKRAKGRAWVKDKKTFAKLKVQFFLSFLKIPFLAGNYWILYLDDNYKYAIIGDPSRKYLWFLSRTKSIDESIYSNLVDRADKMGFDTSKLLRTTH